MERKLVENIDGKDIILFDNSYIPKVNSIWDTYILRFGMPMICPFCGEKANRQNTLNPRDNNLITIPIHVCDNHRVHSLNPFYTVLMIVLLYILSFCIIIASSLSKLEYVIIIILILALGIPILGFRIYRIYKREQIFSKISIFVKNRQNGIIKMNPEQISPEWVEQFCTINAKDLYSFSDTKDGKITQEELRFYRKCEENRIRTKKITPILVVFSGLTIIGVLLSIFMEKFSALKEYYYEVMVGTFICASVLGGFLLIWLKWSQNTNECYTQLRPDRPNA